MPHGSTIHFVSPDGLFMDWTSLDGSYGWVIVYPSSFFSDENTMEDPDHFDSAGVWRETIAYNPFDPHFKGDYGSAQTMYILSQAFDLLPIDLQEELDPVYEAFDCQNHHTHWVAREEEPEMDNLRAHEPHQKTNLDLGDYDSYFDTQTVHIEDLM